MVEVTTCGQPYTAESGVIVDELRCTDIAGHVEAGDIWHTVMKDGHALAMWCEPTKYELFRAVIDGVLP